MMLTPVSASPAMMACAIGAAPRWRGRMERVNVDAAARRQIEEGAWQDAAVGRHDDQVGRECAQCVQRARIADALRLENGQPTLERQRLHLGRLDGEAATARPIGLADHAHHRVGAREQTLENAPGEGGRPHEEDAPGPAGVTQRTDR